MLNLNLNHLLDYTDWEREKWLAWLPGDQVLKISLGPHRDGRVNTVGELIRHIFCAEVRYIDRLSGQPLTDPATIPAENVEALFRYGQKSRKQLREFISSYPVANWDITQEFKIMDFVIRVTPRKIMVHVVLHEIRHWGQLATLFRLEGMSAGFHDFLFSPVLGGEIVREQAR